MSVDQPLIEALFSEVEDKIPKDLPNERHGNFQDSITRFFTHTTHKVIVNKAWATITFGCLDEGVDEDDDGLVGDPESFLTFFSFSGGKSGLFSTLGEFASYKTTKVLFSIHNQFYIYK